MTRSTTAGLALIATSLGLAACNNNNSTITSLPPPTTSSVLAVTSAQRLIGFEPASAASVVGSVALSGLATGESVVGLSARPSDGLPYVLVKGPTGARVATVDPSTGAIAAGVALVNDPSNTTAFTALAGTSFGVDFNPVPDRLRVVSDSGQNLRINVATGATIVDGALNGAISSGSAAAYTNAFATACRTSLFVIDPATDKLYLQNPPNNGFLQPVGGLGINVSVVNGFDVITDSSGANTAIAALTTSSGSPAVSSTALYSINLTTGAATLLQGFALGTGETPVALAAKPLPAATVITQAAGEMIGLTTGDQLVSFQRSSPAKLCGTAPVSGVASSGKLLGIATRPSTGGLVGLGSDGALYSVTAAGAATALCTLVADPADVTAPFTALDTTASTAYGIGFNPVPDRLRVITSTGTSLRINPNPNGSGQCLVTTDTSLNPGTPSVSAVAYTNTVPAAGSTALYGLDTGSDALIRVGADPAIATAGDPGNPNSGVVTSLGSLGLTGDVAANAGFLIDGRSNAAYAALQVGAATNSTLYTVNLGTGAATAVGAVGGGVPLRGLALTGGTALKVYALTADGHLVSFGQSGNALTPATVTDVAISGLATGDALVGIDFRPATGKLYGLGVQGKLYRLDTTSGAATALSPLAADAADTTAPYTALNSGATFGVDFNPVADRLRVVDGSGNNLRINVETGATTTDTTLTGNAAAVVGAAYLNSYAGATATTLYDLDTTMLYTQVPPNNGTLIPVGVLGVTAIGGTGFDIAGGANGLALAALRTAAGAGPSTLYRLNLATGAATSIGAITSGQQVIGLAIELR